MDGGATTLQPQGGARKGNTIKGRRATVRDVCGEKRRRSTEKRNVLRLLQQKRLKTPPLPVRSQRRTFPSGVLTTTGGLLSSSSRRRPSSPSRVVTKNLSTDCKKERLSLCRQR